jgi:ribosome biogenesis protein Nip4
MKMVPIELKPNLSSCIETLSKKEYERTLNLLLKKGPIDEELGERLEVLRLFLESTDFCDLRSQYEGYLTEGKKVTFLIYSEEGKASYKLIVE